MTVLRQERSPATKFRSPLPSLILSSSAFRPSASPNVAFVKGFIGFLLGGAIGFIVGVVIFRLVADPTDGWADLTSLAGSLFTYAPVGALSGLALGLRKRPWPWTGMAIAGLVLYAIPVLLLGDSSTVTTWGLAAYGFVVGAAAAWFVGRRSASNNPSDRVDSDSGSIPRRNP